MKSISRRSFVAAGAGAVALGLAACGNSGSSATTSAADGEKSYKIGVLQLTQHAALDAANEGFVAALDASGINYTIDQQNANNDQSACSTIASKLVGDNDDLIYVIATPAAQAVAAAVHDANLDLVLMGLANSELIRAGQAEGIRTAQEFFADRNYTDEGLLVSRKLPDAVITDEDFAVARVVRAV